MHYFLARGGSAMEKKTASMYDTLHSGLQGQGSKCIPGDVRGLGLESPPASSPVPGLSVPPLRLGWGLQAGLPDRPSPFLLQTHLLLTLEQLRLGHAKPRT